MKLPRTLLTLALAVAPLAAQTARPKPILGVDRSYLDTAVSPCRDFYGFANGAFDKVPIPGEYASYGVNQEIDERNEAILKGILESAAKQGGPEGSAARRVGDFFASGMDETAIEKAGLQPLAPTFKAIEAVQTPAGLVAEMGRLQAQGVRAGFGFGVQVDDKDSTAMIASFWQGGLGLPERDYYLRPGKEAEAIRQAYVAHMGRIFELAEVGTGMQFLQHDQLCP